MAIINCPGCGKRVPSSAPTCVYCGIKITKESRQLPTYEVRNRTLIKYNGKREAISIPGGIEVIGRGAFDGCNTVKRVTIPDSVTTVGDLAFAGCESL